VYLNETRRPGRLYEKNLSKETPAKYKNYDKTNWSWLGKNDFEKIYYVDCLRLKGTKLQRDVGGVQEKHVRVVLPQGRSPSIKAVWCGDREREGEEVGYQRVGR